MYLSVYHIFILTIYKMEACIFHIPRSGSRLVANYSKMSMLSPLGDFD